MRGAPGSTRSRWAPSARPVVKDRHGGPFAPAVTGAMKSKILGTWEGQKTRTLGGWMGRRMSPSGGRRGLWGPGGAVGATDRTS